MKKALRVVLFVLVSGVILTGAIAYVAPYFLNGPLKKALIKEFNTQTGNEYRLHFTELHIRVLKHSISVDSIALSPIGESQHLRNISASSISINGIKWFSLLEQSFPEFSTVVIDEPHVELLSRRISSKYFDQSDPAANPIPGLETFDLIINNGSGRITRPDKTEIVTIGNISVEAQKVNIDALLTGSKFLFLHDLKINGSGFKWMIHNKLYAFTVNEFYFNKKKERSVLTDIHLTPLADKYDFSSYRGRQIDRISMKMPRMEINGFDLDSLASKKLDVDSVRIYQPWLEIFRDKHKARPSDIQYKPLLHEIATSINFSFGLNNISIDEGEITYEEHKPHASQPGSITFNKVHAEINDFRTLNHPRFYSDTLSLHIESQFLNSSPLTIDMEYPIFDPQNVHFLHVSMGSLDPSKAQDMLINSGFVRVDDGLIESLDADYKLNSDSAKGQVLIRYRDLKVSFLDKENPEKEGFRQKAGDFIANTFVIKSNNTGENPRVGNIDFKRDKEKSIFAYWWKALLSGLKDSIR